MPERFSRLWQSLSPAARRGVRLGAGAWAVVMIAFACFLWLSHGQAVQDWEARIPKAEAKIDSVYLAPQLQELDEADFAPANAPEAAAASDENSAVVLILTDMGFAKSQDDRALNSLPTHVALAFSPYGTNTTSAAAAAIAQKREVIALLPMEPFTFPHDDPGPMALMNRKSSTDNAAMLERLLKPFPEATAAMNFMGSRYLATQASSFALFESLKAKDLPFIEAPAEGAQSVAASAAETTGLPFLRADVLIDAKTTETDIRAQLGELERLSRERGIAVGIARPIPLTFALLDRWLPTLTDKKIVLLPLSKGIDFSRKGE